MRFQLWSTVREGRFWEAEEKKKYRACGSERETRKHVWEGCREWECSRGNWQVVVGWMLEKGVK